MPMSTAISVDMSLIRSLRESFIMNMSVNISLNRSSSVCVCTLTQCANSGYYACSTHAKCGLSTKSGHI